MRSNIIFVSPCHRGDLGIKSLEELEVKFNSSINRWYISPQCCGEYYADEKSALQAISFYKKEILKASIDLAKEKLEKEIINFIRLNEVL